MQQKAVVRYRSPATVDIDETLQFIILEALRYNMKRTTISTGNTARWITPFLLEKFDIKPLYAIWYDLYCFENDYNHNGPSEITIYDNDIKPFLDLKELIEAELQKRGYQFDDVLGRMLAPVDGNGGNSSSNRNRDKRSKK